MRPLNKAILPVSILLIVIILNFDRLLLKLSTYLPGIPESGAFALWHTWWPQYSFQVPDGISYHSYHAGPFPVSSLAYLPVFQSGLFALLQVLVGVIAAFNLVLIISIILTYLTSYLYLRSKQVPQLVAALLPAALVLSAWSVDAISQANLIRTTLWLIPLLFWLWDYWLCEPTLRRLILLVAGLYLAVLCGIQNLMWIFGLFLPYVITTLVVQRKNTEWNEGITQKLLMAILALLLLFFVYPFPAIVRSLSRLQPPFGPTWTAVGDYSFIGLARQNGIALWLLALLPFAFHPLKGKDFFWPLVSIYLILILAGILPEPLQLLSGISGLTYQALDMPDFLGGATQFALMMVAALALKDIPDFQNRQWIITGSIAAMIVAGGIADAPSPFAGLTVHKINVHPFYTRIANEPEDYFILDYPVGLISELDQTRSGDGAYLFEYAAWHHKRTVSGISPYYEPALLQNSGLFVETIEGHTGDIQSAIAKWRIGYVVVHLDLLDSNNLEMIQEVLDQSEALCPPTEEDNLLIYRARWHPYGCD